MRRPAVNSGACRGPSGTTGPRRSSRPTAAGVRSSSTARRRAAMTSTRARSIWEAAGLGENSVPQMVQHGDLVFAMSGHTIKLLMAIRLGRTGALTGTDGDRVVHGARRLVHAVAAPPRRPAVRRQRRRPGELLRRPDRPAVLRTDAGCRSRTTSRRRPSARTASSTSRPRRATSSSSASAIDSRCWRPTR